MLTQIITVASRSRRTLVQDLLGVVALMVLLLACLFLPGFG
ncbi:hypothetical protein [Pseudooceanicola aestuarii]|nr:hypothetical protein [Pseudooceanicola aestuarii]